jgi:Glycosyl hydrolase family 65, C-terminal domain
MSAPSRSLLDDELESVVSALCARFPTRPRSDVEDVVTDVYGQLAGGATITAHLIPLTLNRSRRLLSGPDAGEPGTFGRRTGRGLRCARRHPQDPRGPSRTSRSTGLEMRRERIVLGPLWPESAGKLEFSLRYRGHRLRLSVTGRSATLSAEPADAPSLVVECRGRVQILSAGSTVEFAE